MSATLSAVPAANQVGPPAGSQVELNGALQQLQDLVAQHAELSAVTAAAMRNLFQLCETRFNSEEKSAWFTGIADSAPWLQPQSAKLSRQHDELRQRLAVLCRSAEHHLPMPKAWQFFSAVLNEFQAELTAHEETEREVCYQVYMTDVGTKD